MKTTKAILTELGACHEAVKWAGRKTHKKAWETCKRGEWLLWIAGKVDIDRKLLVLAACACAAARDASYDAALAAARKDMAAIVRKIIPFSVIKKAIADYEGKQ